MWVWRCIAVFVYVSLASCSTESEFCIIDRNVVQDELVKSVCDYYQAESSRSFETTYMKRPDSFRRLVPREKYVSQMTSDSNAWELTGVQIKNVKSQGNKAAVEISFHERTSKGATMFQGTAIWIKQDSGWRCYDCVSRGRFALNAPLALEEIGSSKQ